jgi:hypothetical protein
MAETEAHDRTAPPGSPDDPLQRAEAAFAAGDHARVRRALADLQREGKPDARPRAAELARAVSVDPALVAVLLACLAGFAYVFVHYVLE